MNIRSLVSVTLASASFLGISLLSGCGGSSKEEAVSLPIGTQRTIKLTIPENVGNNLGGTVFAFAFEVTSPTGAVVFDGRAPASSTGTTGEIDRGASIHVNGYNPAQDTCERISLSWRTLFGPSNVELSGITNVTKGTGTIANWIIIDDTTYPAETAGTDGVIEVFHR